MDMVECSYTTTNTRKSENLFKVSFADVLSGEAHRDFQRALKQCCSHLSPSSPCHSTVYADTVVLTAFVPGVQSPLSKFVGTHKNTLVLVSHEEPQEEPVTTPSTTPSELIPTSSSHSTKREENDAFAVLTRQQVTTSSSKQHRHYLHAEQSLLMSSCCEDKRIVVDLGAKLVPMETARHIASFYCQAMYGDPHAELPDMWILCDGGESKIVAMGYSVEVPCSSNRNHRTLRSYTILETNPVIVSTSKLKLDVVAPTIQRSPQHKLDMRNWWAYSEYDIATGTESDCLSEDSPLLLLQFVWSGVDRVVCPPPITAEAVLSVSVKPGYQFSPVVGIFDEVNTLFCLASIAYGLKGWPAADEEEPLDTTTHPSLVSKVGIFLEDATGQMLKAVESSVISPITALSTFQSREDLDFLGQLWMFARHVTSPTDLVDSLALIFQAILVGKVQPFIHHTKKSTLATLIRQAMSATSHDQHQVAATKLQNLLTPERALQCLLEIGLEKMERDYFTHFTSNGLVASTQLEPFFVKDVGLLEQCKALCQLHCVLEVVAAAMAFLGLPQQSLSLLTKQALDFYHPTNKFKKFENTLIFLFPFAPNSPGLKSLIDRVASLEPNLWSLTSGEKEKPVMATCTTDPLFKSTRSTSSVSSDVDNTTMCVYHAHCTSFSS